ncbi:proton-conducting transporter transmembrane domain-containing protein, partial [Agrobacterium pusense]
MTLATILPFIVALPFVGALLTAFMPREGAAAAPASVAGAVALFGLVSSIFLYTSVSGGAVLKYDVEWLPQLGLNFTLRLDGFAWIFSMLITGIGLLVVLYARYYMSTEDPIPRFFAFLLAFMGSMLGVVLSGNVILLSIFWEMTSIFSFLLIGYWHQNAGARDGARMALTVTGIGGFSLLAGLLILGHMAGSYDLDRIIEAGAAIRAHPLYVPALIL